VIDIIGLKKSFGTVPVLRGIDLNVAKGEVVALVGRSGCGKSTLLRCINFLEAYQSGEIRLGGEELWYETNGAVRKERGRAQVAAARQKMGVVFQQYNLFPHMTALQNVCLGPIEAQHIARHEAEARGIAVLERVGLGHRAHAYPNQLSGGQQQRVAIARALAMQAEILLLDEPTSALDPELVAEVEDVVKGLREEKITMVLVTHSMAFARELADKVAFLAEGEIVEYGSADAVLGQPQDERLKEFVRRIR